MNRTTRITLAALAVFTLTAGTARASSDTVPDDTVPGTDQPTTTVAQHVFPRQEFTADCTALTIHLWDYPTGQTFTLYVDDVQVHGGAFNGTLDLVKPWPPGPHTWTLDVTDQGQAPVQRIIGGFNLLCGTTPTTAPPTTVPATTAPPGVCSDTANGGTVVCPEVTSTTTTAPPPTSSVAPATDPSTTAPPAPTLPHTGSSSVVTLTLATVMTLAGLYLIRGPRRARRPVPNHDQEVTHP